MTGSVLVGSWETRIAKRDIILDSCIGHRRLTIVDLIYLPGLPVDVVVPPSSPSLAKALKTAEQSRRLPFEYTNFQTTVAHDMLRCWGLHESLSTFLC